MIIEKHQQTNKNSFSSEAIPGTIPHGQNSPRNVRFGLYAEQLTATAFVAPRHANKKAWLYRVRPAVAHQGFVRPSDIGLHTGLPLTRTVNNRPIFQTTKIQSAASSLLTRRSMFRPPNLRGYPQISPRKKLTSSPVCEPLLVPVTQLFARV